MSTSSDERMFEMDAEPASPADSVPTQHQTTCRIIEGILGGCTPLEMEIYERAMAHVREMGEETRRSSLKKRLVARLRKDGYDASLCRSSWVATTQHPGVPVSSTLVVAPPKETMSCSCLRYFNQLSIHPSMSLAGEHEYIDVHVAGGGGAGRTRLIVDIDFRSQFQLARPAPWYAYLSARLPAVFVGPPDRLRKAVALLCVASRRSLRESGLHVPPWRRSSYMQAKWFPSPAPLPDGDGAVAQQQQQSQWSVANAGPAGSRRSGLSMEMDGQDGSSWAQ
ncbi:hypothetical protein ZWY2020_027734 [Hordeum vulgare]|nr:hypothetical protein ZWY2020_027734 [Hordeum vulgare]